MGRAEAGMGGWVGGRRDGSTHIGCHTEMKEGARAMTDPSPPAAAEGEG